MTEPTPALSKVLHILLHGDESGEIDSVVNSDPCLTGYAAQAAGDVLNANWSAALKDTPEDVSIIVSDMAETVSRLQRYGHWALIAAVRGRPLYGAVEGAAMLTATNRVSSLSLDPAKVVCGRRERVTRVEPDSNRTGWFRVLSIAQPTPTGGVPAFVQEKA